MGPPAPDLDELGRAPYLPNPANPANPKRGTMFGKRKDKPRHTATRVVVIRVYGKRTVETEMTLDQYRTLAGLYPSSWGRHGYRVVK